jgi:hypothetical protein
MGAIEKQKATTRKMLPNILIELGHSACSAHRDARSRFRPGNGSKGGQAVWKRHEI